MRLIRGLHNLTRQQTACVATIGKFDGIHLGHQQIIAAVVNEAKARRLPAAVLLFEPDPQEYFQGEKAPARLSPLREKYNQLKLLGVDWLVCLSFNQRLASMPADSFIEQVLVDKLQLVHLIVGDDFRFGAGRKGDFDLLLQRGKGRFSVQTTLSIKRGTERISSTLIRATLAAGDFSKASELLGYSYFISGRVSHGDKVGRTLGFPTLNIPLKRKTSPLNGVFCVEVVGVDSKVLYGVANLGSRPTLGQLKPRLEVHLLDYRGDCYGKQVKVTFIKKMRDEKKFASLDALKLQIEQDVQSARRLSQLD